MPGMHLGNESVGDVSHIEASALLGNHRMKEHLQQDVSQFLSNGAIVAFTKCVVKLVRFLDQVGAK